MTGTDKRMEQVYSVSQINRYIKNMFTGDYILGNIYMKGEVSNCKYHSSGHIYFTLKDETGQMACVMFAGQRAGLNFRLEEGQSVIAGGSINVYERDGRYQMYVREISLDGIGILYERYERLKAKLEKEGCFDESHKKEIPRYVKRIGIVTAYTGAAIRDIVQIAKRRNPYVQLILYPALVQGEGAAASIVRGIELLDRAGVDVIIAGRGGGSIEDLWAFNEEEVARAVYRCNTPVISAVGHETDTTIIDYVSDLRAPTPSAAAELAVYDISLITGALTDYHYMLAKGMMDKIQYSKEKCLHYRTRLNYVSPGHMLDMKKQQADEYSDRLKLLFERVFAAKKNELRLYIQKLKGLSPLEKLESGFAYVSDKTHKVLTSTDRIEEGDIINIDFKDGTVMAEAKTIIKRQL